MQATEAEIPVKICARAWKVHARFSIAVHEHLTDSMVTKFSHTYISSIIEQRALNMQKNKEGMSSLDLITIAIPRTVGIRKEAPVVCILHGSHMMQMECVEGLFRIPGVTAAYEPLDYGIGNDFASNQTYAAFRAMSSKLPTVSVIRQHDWLSATS